jgi:hypothetical protein
MGYCRGRGVSISKIVNEDSDALDFIAQDKHSALSCRRILYSWRAYWLLT